MNEQQERNEPRPEEEAALDSPSPEAPAAAEPMAPDCQDCPRRNDQQTTDGGDRPNQDEPLSDKEDEPLSDKQDEPIRPEECQRTCKRNFWTEVLRTIVKVATIILAAFGLSRYDDTTPTLPGE